jgi:HD-GYP domain-containing protein (c-di-GMP phosphodiesterase class II)
MYTEHDFFVIEKINLKDTKIFPFQLYIYNPLHKKYSLILNGNRPLTKESETFIDFLLERGGNLAVLTKQKRTFLQAQQFKEEDIPSLKNRVLHHSEKEQLAFIADRESYIQTNGTFDFHSEFEKAVISEDFTSIINYARIEILTFSVCHSPTTSFSINLAKEYLVKDTFINRIVAVSFFSAKTMNLNDQSTLSDIVVGCFLMHLGYTQLPLRISRTAFVNLKEADKNRFKKHTLLSTHLIKRGDLNISERCKKIITDHHERSSGQGYPGEKLSESIDTLALLIGGISHLFEFSSGKLTGNKQPIHSTIRNIKNKNFIPGLEFDFGDKIFDIIVNLINTDNIEQKKSA